MRFGFFLSVLFFMATACNKYSSVAFKNLTGGFQYARRGWPSKMSSNSHTTVTEKLTSATTITNVEQIYVSVNSNCEEGDSTTNSGSTSWHEEAANILRDYGVVALQRGGDFHRQQQHLVERSGSVSSMVLPQICDKVNAVATSRVKAMHRRIERRGMDPNGVEDGPYRFMEIVCRDEGGKRYDVPVDWLGDDITKNRSESDSGRSGGMGTPLNQKDEEVIGEFHSCLDRIVTPVLDALWSQQQQQPTTTTTSSSSYVGAAGFLVNQPGSKTQDWHRDGPDEGYIDVFVPLIDLTDSIGPTQIRPGTHLISDEEDLLAKATVMAPTLRKGEVLLFDYRTLHRGRRNKSRSTTRTLAYVVYKRWKHNNNTFIGDKLNFPAAMTLEYD